MALLNWKREFETGIAPVDYEHLGMVTLLNELHGAMAGNRSADTVRGFLGEVHARIAAHFALEEKIMRECGYDEYAGHKAEHECLLDQIRDIMDEHDRGAYDNADALLAERLRAWFGVHFATRDARLHRLLG